MPIRVECPTCRKQFNAPDAFAGRRGKCPACATVIQIPAPQSPVDGGANLMDLLEEAGQAERALPTQPQSKSSVAAARARAQKSGRWLPAKNPSADRGRWGGLPVVLILGSAVGVTAVAAPIGFWARSQPLDTEMGVATAMMAGTGLIFWP